MNIRQFARPIFHASPLQLWFFSQLLFWIPSFLAMVVAYAVKGTGRIAWLQTPFGGPSALTATMLLFWVLSLTCSGWLPSTSVASTNQSGG